jgi:hypothetical protein
VTTSLKPMQIVILGTAIVELLHGELSDETIAAVDSLKREDIPEPLNNMVGWMQGMSTYPPLHEHQITSLIDEIRGAATEVLEERVGYPGPNTWAMMQSFFFDLVENEHVEDMIEEEITMLHDLEHVQAWTVPLINHVKSSKARHKELMIELLVLFEEIIKKRRAELQKENTS